MIKKIHHMIFFPSFNQKKKKGTIYIFTRSAKLKIYLLKQKANLYNVNYEKEKFYFVVSHFCCKNFYTY